MEKFSCARYYRFMQYFKNGLSTKAAGNCHPQNWNSDLIKDIYSRVCTNVKRLQLQELMFIFFLHDHYTMKE